MTYRTSPSARAGLALVLFIAAGCGLNPQSDVAEATAPENASAVPNSVESAAPSTNPEVVAEGRDDLERRLARALREIERVEEEVNVARFMSGNPAIAVASMGEDLQDWVEEERQWLDDSLMAECYAAEFAAYTDSMSKLEDASARLFEFGDDPDVALTRFYDALAEGEGAIEDAHRTTQRLEC